MTERETTGIDGLDDILEGGLPEGATVLLLGPPGVGKSTFVNQFMNTGLAQDQGGLYVTLDDAPDEVKSNALSFDWDFDSYEDRFLFMDAYSWKLGEEVDSKYAIQGPSDLNQLNMTLTDALRDIGDVKKRVVIDSVSTLVIYTDVNSAVKFLQVASAKTKANDGVLLMTVEEGAQDDQDVSTLNYVADGVLKFKMEGDDRYVSVSRMSKTDHNRDWHQFEITDDGIQLVE
ncbi:MAG: ATPase domain-containing protein [Candidatus Nanohaloarchaea archaeon]|nr:ATPase domain-containing protein [Candidatus Nanohaloarchaea archaeon]